MAWIVLKRLLSAGLLFCSVAAVAFLLTGLGDLDPGRSILGPSATPAEVAAENNRLGMDRSMLVQFGDWAGALARGDLGSSYLNNQPVTAKVGEHLPVTTSLVALSLLIVTVLSLVLGMLAATGRGWVDRTVQVLAVVGHVLPTYLIALLLLVLFAVQLDLFPVFGYVPFDHSPGEWLRALALPVAALTIGGVAAVSLQARGALLDALDTDYVRTLRSRGISSRSVLFRHALRNAAPPWLTSLSLGFVGMLGGAFMIEKVFAMPGLGTLAIDATTSGDRPVIMGLVVLTGSLVILINLLTDLAQLWLVPKARAR